jgi:flagellar hook-length control protein FliK
MTQTTTDYLYAVPPPVQDRSFGTSTNDRDGSFNDHLSQASSSSSDDYRPNGSFTARSTSDGAAGPKEKDYRSDQGPQESERNPQPDANKSTTVSQQAVPSAGDEHPALSDHKQGERTSAEKKDEPDKRDHLTAADVAAAQAAAQNEHTNQKSTSTKAKVATDGVPAAQRSSNESQPGTSELAAAHELTQLQPAGTESPATNRSEDAYRADATRNQTENSTSATTPAKNRKVKSVAKNEAGAAEHEASQGNPHPIQTADQELSSDAAQTGSQIGRVTINDLKAKGESASNDKAKDDSRHESAKDGKSGATATSADQNVKLNAAQLVTPSASSLNEPTVNSRSKDSNEEQAVKPVAGTNETAAASFARLTRAGAAIGRESGAKRVDELPAVDPARFVGRVAKAFQTAQDRGGSLQIRLSPPELGALRVELTVKDGVMSASLQTENSIARRLLLDHLPTLRDRLAEQNIRVDRFDVDVRRDGTGGNADARGSQHQQFQHQPDQPSPRRQAVAQQLTRESAASDVIEVGPRISDAGLNLIV